MRKNIKFLAVIFAGVLQLSAATYTVGPGKTYATIGAVPALSACDIVEIWSGTYNECKKWTASGSASNPIIIKGMGPTEPIIDGKTGSTYITLTGTGGVPRALFEFSGGSYYVVQNLEFKNAYNGPSGGGSWNGAGIRMTGGSSNITIRNCRITQCEDGLMSDSASNLSVEYCEVANNGDDTKNDANGPGYAHNFYMSGTSIRVLGCYIHDSRTGHNFKSRMHYVELLYNYIVDANSAEVDIVDGTESAPVNSNAVLIGNVIKKRTAAPKSGIAGNDSQFIIFGQDVGGTRTGNIYMINNTVIAGKTSNKFLQINSSTKAYCYNNIFYGSNTMTADAFTQSNTSGSNNWIPSTAVSVPASFASLQGSAPGFLSVTDYHIGASAAVVNAGTNSPAYKDGSGSSNSGVPAYEYVATANTQNRASDGQLDIGAFEYGTYVPPVGGGGADPFVNVKTYPNPFRISDSANKMVKLNNIPTWAKMDIFDINGSKIRSLKEGDGGFSNMIFWDGKNDGGDSVPSGTYIYVLQDSAGNKKKGKIALLK